MVSCSRSKYDNKDEGLARKDGRVEESKRRTWTKSWLCHTRGTERLLKQLKRLIFCTAVVVLHVDHRSIYIYIDIILWHFGC
jgi:hypothetical protein